MHTSRSVSGSLSAAAVAILLVMHLASGEKHAQQTKRRDLQPMLQSGQSPGAAGAGSSEPLKGILAGPEEITASHLQRWVREGANSVVLMASSEGVAGLRAAARRIRAARLELYYWIEVARDTGLASTHPEWMASLQGHPEWRRHFPKFPEAGNGEVVKNYPWVPILYQEAFDAHLLRISGLLSGLPRARGVFLNDLQSAPSACGCGNSLCRWTPDYGPIHTATRLSADAAARFAKAVAALKPEYRVIPVWTTECEEMDKENLCANVGCFAGLCWKESTTQLMPLASNFEHLGVLLPFRDMRRDLPRYGSAGGWAKQALKSFSELPPRWQGAAVTANRLIPILQGWNVTEAERRDQIRLSQEAGSTSYVVAVKKIDQRWGPRMLKVQGLGHPVRYKSEAIPTMRILRAIQTGLARVLSKSRH